VFLHGFGSTKEDYADVAQQEQLADRPVLAYDAPGCGATTSSDLTGLSIPFLVAVAAQVLREADRALSPHRPLDGRPDSAHARRP
jgi:pimeloyl-ACP methyl ester carboxylesterase